MKKRKTKHQKRKERNNKRKPLIVIFLDQDGCTVRFERMLDELFVFVDGELTTRRVQIIKVDRDRGWIILKGDKIENNIIHASGVKTVVELRKEDIESMFPRILNICHWHGPFIIGSTLRRNGKKGILTNYDGLKNQWQFTSVPQNKNFSILSSDLEISDQQIKNFGITNISIKKTNTNQKINNHQILSKQNINHQHRNNLVNKKNRKINHPSSSLKMLNNSCLENVLEIEQQKQIHLEWSILPFNCKKRKENELYSFMETEQSGLNVMAKQDILAEQIILKDRAFLFLKHHPSELCDQEEAQNILENEFDYEFDEQKFNFEQIYSFPKSDINISSPPLQIDEEHLNRFGNLFHVLHTHHHKTVWTYLTTCLSDCSQDYISHFASHGISIQKELARKCEKYQESHWQETFSRLLAIFYANRIIVESCNEKLNALFPILSSFNHHCYSNCKIEFGEDHCGFFACIKTNRYINKGEMLCVNYEPELINSTKSISFRQNILKEKHGFLCHCSFCLEQEPLTDLKKKKG